MLLGVTLSACAREPNPLSEPPDPHCASGAKIDTGPLFRGVRLTAGVLVNDSLLYWESSDDRSFRRTSLTTGCTLVIAQREKYKAFGSGLGNEESLKRAYPTFDSKLLELPLREFLSNESRLIAWPGDSVAISDPGVHRTMVLTLAAKPIIRAFRDTTSAYVTDPIDRELAPKFYTKFEPYSNAYSGVRPAWSTGRLRLEKLGDWRVDFALPFAAKPDTVLYQGLASVWVPRSTGSWHSLFGVGPGRIATTNSVRDSIFTLDTTGRTRAIPVAWPSFHISAEIARRRKERLVQSYATIASGKAKDSLLAQVSRLIATVDSEPALVYITLGDSSIWVYVDDSSFWPDRGLLMAEVTDRGEVLRCGFTHDIASIIGRELLIVTRLNSDSLKSQSIFARSAPPACPVHRFADLRAWLRSTPATPRDRE